MQTLNESDLTAPERKGKNQDTSYKHDFIKSICLQPTWNSKV